MTVNRKSLVFISFAFIFKQTFKINMLKITLPIWMAVSILISWKEKKDTHNNDLVIAKGQMPSLVKDKNGNLHLVYGFGDSIMYSYSSDMGKSFSSPALILFYSN